MARKGFTDEQRAMLRKAFEENESLAEKGRKTKLAAETGLNESQVKNWFHDHKKTKKGKTTTGNNTSWDANTVSNGTSTTTTPSSTNNRAKAAPPEATETAAAAQAANINAYFRW